jgi:hypothetical protein
MAASPEQGDRRHQKNRSHFQSCNDEGGLRNGERQAAYYVEKTGDTRRPACARAGKAVGGPTPIETKRRGGRLVVLEGTAFGS